MTSLGGEIVGALLDPQLGLPALLLTALLVAWLALRPQLDPPPAVPRPSWQEPAGDPVSSLYFSLERTQYSPALAYLLGRVNRYLWERHRVILTGLPATARGARRQGMSADEFRGYRRLERQVREAWWLALLVERPPARGSIFAPLHPWRKARLERRLAQVLPTLERLARTLESGGNAGEVLGGA